MSFCGLFFGVLSFACSCFSFPPSKQVSDVIDLAGDNPKSDIKGTNEAGENWYSILVRSGCFKGTGNDAQYPARFVCDTVKEAVEHIMERERQDLK